jgi:hypothetical protein
MHQALGEAPGEVDDVLGLAVREPAGAQLGRFLEQDSFGRDRAGTGDHAIPYALRRLYRNLLADDCAREGEKRLSTAHEKHLGAGANDRAHHRILAR